MEKSKCCTASVKVYSSGEGTSYYVCGNCSCGCDIAEPIEEKNKTLLLNKCKWEIEILELKMGEGINAQWTAQCRTMDGYRFANGGVGSIRSLRIFESPKRAKEGWIEFAKINEISNYQFITQ